MVEYGGESEGVRRFVQTVVHEWHWPVQTYPLTLNEARIARRESSHGPVAQLSVHSMNTTARYSALIDNLHCFSFALSPAVPIILFPILLADSAFLPFLFL